jgi:uncharacterized protein (DUF1697 family)
MLRGINVGGKAKLPMADLRRIVEGCGFEDVRTYIQSGNVVFSGSGRSSDAVAKRLQAAIADGSNVKPEVAVRSRAELAKVVDANPFLARGADAADLHVTFLCGNTRSSAALGGLDLASYAPDEAIARNREVYLYLPNGLGRSKLAADLARRGKTEGTTRNWRTVTTLLDMADAT